MEKTLKDCECLFHQYHVFHYCLDCKEMFSHSQRSMDQHKYCQYQTAPIEHYIHKKEY